MVRRICMECGKMEMLNDRATSKYCKACQYYIAWQNRTKKIKNIKNVDVMLRTIKYMKQQQIISGIKAETLIKQINEWWTNKYNSLNKTKK